MGALFTSLTIMNKRDEFKQPNNLAILEMANKEVARPNDSQMPKFPTSFLFKQRFFHLRLPFCFKCN